MKNPEKLIGKKVRGFKFDECYYVPYNMDEFIGKTGTVEVILQSKDRVLIDFGNSNSWIYPADQIEAHLVEDEIPTLSDGVMMLVSDDNKTWEKYNVIGQKNNLFFAWVDNCLVYYAYCKPIEPTKEEQLTAILGSSEKVSEIMDLFKN